MAAPKVQSLSSILASLEPAYKPQRALYNQQISALPGAETSALGALDVAKSNNFRDIRQGANASGLAFSGIPIEEQTRYLGEKYLPAVAGVKQGTQTQQFSLQQAIAALNSEQRLKGLDTRTDQQKALDAYLEAERDRRFKAQQAALDRNVDYARIGASSQPDVDPAKEFLNHIASQFKKAGGQGSRNVTRQQQDNWANAFFTANKITSPKARQVYWDLFNQTYNRVEDETKDWRYKR